MPGTAPVLTLNGTEYDNCPAYLIGTFMLDNASFVDDEYYGLGRDHRTDAGAL